VRLRIRPWARRLLTRSLAIVPALIVIGFSGSENIWGAGSVDERLLNLLVLSQVILSFQLPFAIVPLIQFTSERPRMGELTNGTIIKSLGWCCAIIVVGLNAFLIYMQMGKWVSSLAETGRSPLLIYGTAGPLALGLAGFLGWLVVYPRFKGHREVAFAPVIPL